MIGLRNREASMTDRMQAPTAEEWERMLDALPIAVNVKDRGGRWLYANPAMLKAFGIEDANYRGKTDVQQVPEGHFHQPALDYCERTDAETWEAGGVARTIERIPQPDGSISAFDVTKVVVPGERGRDRLMVLGKPAERQLALEARLAEQQPEVELGRLVPALSHDLNNLLTVILGHAELSLGLDGSGDEAFDPIVKAVQLACSLTGTALSMGAGGKDSRETVDLAGRVALLARLSWPRNETRSLSLRLPPQPTLISCDGILFGRALLNLLVNAHQWTGPGGNVVVTLEEGDDELRLLVDDDGPGIPEAERQRVFEAGVTHRADGTGLGLSLVDLCARMHDGTCRIEASPLGGCRVRLHLPRAAVRAPAPAPERQELAAPRNLRIGIVDPDASVASVTVRLLEGPHAPITFAHPHALLAAAKEGKIDVAIVELDSPYLDGLQLHAALEAERLPIPLILCTTTASDLRLRGGAPPGVTLLLKPFRRHELLTAIARARRPHITHSTSSSHRPRNG